MCVMSKAACSLPYPPDTGQGAGDVQFTLILHRHSYSVGVLNNYSSQYFAISQCSCVWTIMQPKLQ